MRTLTSYYRWTTGYRYSISRVVKVGEILLQLTSTYSFWVRKFHQNPQEQKTKKIESGSTLHQQNIRFNLLAQAAAHYVTHLFSYHHYHLYR